MTRRNIGDSAPPTRGHWINLHTTDDCNLSCSYCYLRNKEKRTPTYDLERIVRLVEAAPGAVTICFFGGEPTLNIPFMQRVIERLSATACSFAIQTNGTLLDKVPREMLESFVGIGVSIDGAEEVMDAVRGKGTFRRVVDNVCAVKEIVRVPIMARMTLTEKNDFLRDWDVLMDHFDAIYWQLDNDLGERDHADFAQRYITALPKLIDLWERRAREGRIINLIPFFGVYWLLTSPRGRTGMYYHCDPGAGAITVDAAGTIFSCPEGVFRGGHQMGGKDIIGTLADVDAEFPYMLHNHKEECGECDIFPICAGRCIWTRQEPYCACTKALVSTVKENGGRLWRYMDRPKLAQMWATILTTEIIP